MATSTKDRKTAPTARTTYDDQMYFRVWTESPSYLEDQLPWKCVAMFRFLTSCLDYIADCQDAGVDVIFQSPADTRLVKHDERRVVYRPETATV